MSPHTNTRLDASSDTPGATARGGGVGGTAFYGYFCCPVKKGFCFLAKLQQLTALENRAYQKFFSSFFTFPPQ
jgi:hypothetical protein